MADVELEKMTDVELKQARQDAVDGEADFALEWGTKVFAHIDALEAELGAQRCTAKGSAQQMCEHREAQFGCSSCVSRVRAKYPEFPLMPSPRRAGVPSGPACVPWSVADKAWAEYSKRYGREQSVEKIAERGGFAWGEMDILFPGWREAADEWRALRAQVDALTADNATLLAEWPEILCGCSMDASGVRGALLPDPRCSTCDGTGRIGPPDGEHPGAALLEASAQLRQYQRCEETSLAATLARVLAERARGLSAVPRDDYEAQLARVAKLEVERDGALAQGQADHRALHDALVWAHTWHGKNLPPPSRAVVALITERDALRAELKTEHEKTSLMLMLGVGNGNGQLFVYGDNPSINVVRDLFRERDALRERVTALEGARCEALPACPARGVDSGGRGHGCSMRQQPQCPGCVKCSVSEQQVCPDHGRQP